MTTEGRRSGDVRGHGCGRDRARRLAYVAPAWSTAPEWACWRATTAATLAFEPVNVAYTGYQYHTGQISGVEASLALIPGVRALGRTLGEARVAGEAGNIGRVYEGGAYGRLSAERGVIERHHLPADSVSPFTTYSGPAIQMDYADHLMTSSHGSQGLEGALYRADIKALIDNGNVRGAMAIEIRDVRRVSTLQTGSLTKYNGATRQMLNYAKSRDMLRKGL